MGHLSRVEASSMFLGLADGRALRCFSSAMLVLLLVLSFTSVVHAEAPVEEARDVDWAYQMAHELMSPFCPGRTLAECPSPNAAELRLWILNQAAAGASKAEIEEMLYERFGEVIRSSPKVEGWGVTAYLFPVLFFVIGGPLAWWLLRRLVKPEASQPADAQPASPIDVDPELERELERELGRP